MEISHSKENIVGIWAFWYFVEMPKEILQAWKNFLRFNFNFFSIPLLLKTLFSHWKRYYWVRGRGFNFSEYFNVLFSNLTSRFLGAMVRFVLIIVGIFCEILVFLFGLTIFVGWFFLPIILVLGIFLGFFLIII